MPETQMLLCVQQFALILVASQYLTLVRIKVGCVSATDLYTTNSDVFVKALPLVTFPQSTIRCMVKFSVLRRCNSLTSHPSICMSELLQMTNGLNSKSRDPLDTKYLNKTRLLQKK